MENQNQGNSNQGGFNLNKDNSNQGSVGQQFNQTNFGQSNNYGQNQVPNGSAALVLGIISIVMSFCYGVPGLICGIIGLFLSAQGNRAYNENPSNYSEASVKNLRAGKICSIIGTCLSAAILLIFVVYIVIFGALFSAVIGSGMH